MKWFFAFNQQSEDSYGDFVRVAVASAREKTRLEAFCLYDGAPCELTRWMEKNGVTIFETRFRFAKWWERHAQISGNSQGYQIASGTFLRFELPEVMQREKMSDEFALYTDCDVMFERDVSSPLQSLQPRYFAVAPETFSDNRLHMNAGVMWMNARRLRAGNEAFMTFGDQHMEQASRASFDQGIYRAYFNPPHKLAWKLGIPDRYFYAVMSRLRFKTWKWDDLPLELNWKPYWGENPNAAIVHFHGLKPTQREQLRRGELPPNIMAMHCDEWEKQAANWDEWLEKARAL